MGVLVTEMGTMPSLAQLRVKELPSTTMRGMPSIKQQLRQLLDPRRSHLVFSLVLMIAQLTSSFPSGPKERTQPWILLLSIPYKVLLLTRLPRMEKVG